MDAATTVSIQRTATALISAATRRDHEAMAALVAATEVEHLPALTVLCSVLTAHFCRHLEDLDTTLDYQMALQQFALRLAATPL